MRSKRRTTITHTPPGPPNGTPGPPPPREGGGVPWPVVMDAGGGTAPICAAGSRRVACRPGLARHLRDVAPAVDAEGDLDIVLHRAGFPGTVIRALQRLDVGVAAGLDLCLGGSLGCRSRRACRFCLRHC